MPTWRLRDFHDDDLDRAIQIWDQDRQTDDMPPVFPVSEAMAEARTGGTAVVAVVGEDLVGMAVAQAQGERAWITLVALARMWRNRGIGSALIAEIERRLRTQGVRRIGALLVPGTTGTTALENSGYRTRDGLTFTRRSSISARAMRVCSRSSAGGCCRRGSGVPSRAWNERKKPLSGGSCCRWPSPCWPTGTG